MLRDMARLLRVHGLPHADKYTVKSLDRAALPCVNMSQ